MLLALVAVSVLHFAFGAGIGLRVVFPDLGLLKNRELIEEIHVEVACGHIESVAAIPMDWNIDVVRIISGVEEFHATAGHGASRIWSLGKFNGGIRVVPLEAECFDVNAKVLVSGENVREIEIPRSKLKLIP